MIFFISGHRNITESQFNIYYKPSLDHAILVTGRKFVVGDYYGVDIMAQEYLKGKVSDSDVTVYHMSEKPRNYVEGFCTKGGYAFDEERDAAMTNESDIDIAWSQNPKSGTARNLERRKELNQLNLYKYVFDNITSYERSLLISKFDETQLDIKECIEKMPKI